MLLAVVGSSSIPFLFPPHIFFEGNLHVDGVSAYGGDFISAVARYREIVDDDSKIVLDVILCHSKDISICFV